MKNNNYQEHDLPDSSEDQEKLKPDHAVLNLPELNDIPGALQSLKNRQFSTGNLTISSADEEGDDLLENQDDQEEEDVLFDPPEYENPLAHAISLDDRDNDGDLLEEAGQESDLFGRDLDDPLIQEEDEEASGPISNKGEV